MIIVPYMYHVLQGWLMFREIEDGVLGGEAPWESKGIWGVPRAPTEKQGGRDSKTHFVHTGKMVG